MTKPTAFILEKLENFYQSLRFVTIAELRVGTGFDGLSKRRIDLLAISAEKGNNVIGVEIKASKADFLKDLKDPAKQKPLRCFSNEFYYATPKGLIEPNDLPQWAGLIEVRTDAIDKPVETRFNGSTYIRDGETFKAYFRESANDKLLTPFVQVKISAPYLENSAPTWGLVAEIIRNKKRTKR
ncbi:MAG: MmcB family DNA repair protein [Helicobacteraceae bacterium]|jgi:hypothetical protein|nr:MmcB family DNA repair protein [Helicobacteraceae bacterium]